MENKLTLTVDQTRGRVYSAMAQVPGIHLLFIGALACVRHRSFEMAELQRAGRLSFLCLDEVDFITGAYLTKIQDAITEINEERHPTGFLLTPGCQSALLSTDYNIMVEEMEKKLGVPIRVHEACHLCGFGSDSVSGKPDTVEQLIFDYLTPAKPGAEVSVNIISSMPLNTGCELYSLLKSAGVTSVNEIRSCKTFEEYQRMAQAHLNIICSGNAESLGKYLEARLGIPYVTLSGVYSSSELGAAYERIGQILGADIDTADLEAHLDARVKALCGELLETPLAVEGSPAAAKWLISVGVPVTAVSAGHHAAIEPELLQWFKENAPEISLQGVSSFKNGKESGRGFKGGRNGNHGVNGERSGSHSFNSKRNGGHGFKGGGRGFGGRSAQDYVSVGFFAADGILDRLENAIRSIKE